MGNLFVVGLLLLFAVLLFGITRSGRFDETLERLANIAQLVALVAAVLVFVIPPPEEPPPPKGTETPTASGERTATLEAPEPTQNQIGETNTPIPEVKASVFDPQVWEFIALNDEFFDNPFSELIRDGGNINCGSPSISKRTGYLDFNLGNGSPLKCSAFPDIERLGVTRFVAEVELIDSSINSHFGISISCGNTPIDFLLKHDSMGYHFRGGNYVTIVDGEDNLGVIWRLEVDWDFDNRLVFLRIYNPHSTTPVNQIGLDCDNQPNALSFGTAIDEGGNILARVYQIAVFAE